LTARTVIHQEEEAVETRKGVEPDLTQDIGPDVLARLDWEYPHGEATEQAAKTSVSALRRQNAATEDDEARVWISAKPKSGLGGAEIGAAHHVFLEAASLERLTSAEGVKAEIEQLAKAGLLSDAQKETLDVEGLAAFWESETGGQVLAQRRFIKRELAFTARFGREDMAAASLAKTGQAREDGEFVVVQGVVDLAVIMPEEIWIIDFKTDRFAPTELADKVAQYRTQVELYGAALERIYKRPVSRLWLSFLRQRQVVLL
jgi:ATP-dependent helicase/nuclease subunit A